jgi:hypothetical protein
MGRTTADTSCTMTSGRGSYEMDKEQGETGVRDDTKTVRHTTSRHLYNKL